MVLILKSHEICSLLFLSVMGWSKISIGGASSLSPDVIRRAVFHEQADVFSRVPGVGKKKRSKDLLQLQDRCHPWGRWRRFL